MPVGPVACFVDLVRASRNVLLVDLAFEDVYVRDDGSNRDMMTLSTRAMAVFVHLHSSALVRPPRFRLVDASVQDSSGRELVCDVPDGTVCPEAGTTWCVTRR
jgi:hypothetical protein